MAKSGEPGVSHPDVVLRWLKASWDAHPLVVAAGAAVVALAVIVGLIWPITDFIAAHDVGLITGPKRAAALQAAREAVRTQLLTLGAGVFAAGALIFTARNFTLSRRTVELTRRSVELTEQGQRRTFELTEEGQVTDRYIKAIEQLGSDKPDVRIGGIYALERVARDSARDHPTVMEVLAVFIREHSREVWPPSDEQTDAAPRRGIRPDVQAAVTVIRRRNPGHDRQQINLTRALLPGADLTGAILPGALLPGADLTGALLSGADLTGADLTGAKLDRADLTGADLTGAKLPGAFTAADLSGAKLPHADLADAKLPSANLSRADLTYADLTRTDLSDAKLPHADLSDAKLKEADLARTDLTYADLTRADLTDAFLTRAFLTGADLTHAILTRTDLTRALWPTDAAVPEGWQRDTDSGVLKRIDTNSGDKATN